MIHTKITQKLKRISLFFIVAVFGLSFFSQAGGAAFAQDAGGSQLETQIKTSLYRNALAVCFRESPLSGGALVEQNQRIDESEATKFNWFGGNNGNNVDVNAGVMLSNLGSSTVSASGFVPCANSTFIREALSALGYSDELSGIDNILGLMCDLGFRREHAPSIDVTAGDCKHSTESKGRWVRANVNGSGDSTETKQQFRTSFLKATEGRSVPMSAAARYLLFRETALTLCRADGGQQVDSSYDENLGARIKIIGDNGKEQELFYTWGQARYSFASSVGFIGEGYSAGIINSDGATSPTSDPTGTKLLLVDWRVGYGVFIPASFSIDGGPRNNTVVIGQPIFYGTWGGKANPCNLIAEEANKYFEAYKDFIAQHPEENFSPGGLKNGGNSGGATSSCVIEGIGWIVCPVVNFLAGLADGAFDFLADSFLRTDPGIFNQKNPLEDAWSMMRNFANVAFIIAFLIIIFSQLTSFGVSNYGVKKLLPRLIISAILVNLSYYICQVAVDLSNILGYSLKDLFESLGAQLGGSTPGETTINPFSKGESFAGIAGAVLVTGGAGAILFSTLSAFIPILLAAVVALIMILFILVARQALIIILIVISPLAFVAYLLPNTEQWFKKWRQTFTSLLLVFPIIALVFGASDLASGILLKTYTASYNGKGSDMFGQIIAAGVLVLPLFVVPGLLKKSLDAIPMVGQLANKWSSRANGGLSKQVKEGYAGSRIGKYQNYRRNKRAQNRGLIEGGQFKGKAYDPRTWLSKANNTINTKTGKFGTYVAAGGVSLAEKAQAEETAATEKLIRSQVAGGVSAQTIFEDAVRKGDKVQARAAQNVMFSQGGGGVHSFAQSINNLEGSMSKDMIESLRENISTNHGQYIKGKSIDVSLWAGKGGKKLSEFTDRATTWRLSASDLAATAPKRLTAAVAAGNIDPRLATEMLSDPRISANLDNEQKAALSTAKTLSQAAYDAKFAKDQLADEQDAAYQTYADAGNIKS